MNDFESGAFMGVFVTSLIMVFIVFAFTPDIGLSQEAANDACVHITGNSSAVAVPSIDQKLVCEIPSYDHTTNIIIRKAGENSHD